MYNGNKAKFEQNPKLQESLCQTEGRIIFSDSSSFWSKWNGLIMERLRAEFRKNGKEDEKEVESIKLKMEEYQKQV